MLKDPAQEHILLLNGAGEYELVPYTRIQCRCEQICAYAFTRGERNYAVCWHTTGKGILHLPFVGEGMYEEEPDGIQIPITSEEGKILLPVEGRRYFSTEMPMAALLEAFENAVCSVKK